MLFNIDAQTDGSAPIQMFQPDKGPTSYSGLPGAFNTTFLENLMPQMNNAINNYDANIDQSTNLANQMYSNIAKKAIKKDATGVLNNLASRNILNSTVASDALAKSATNIADSLANKGFETGMLAAGMKAEKPKVLGSLLGQGQVSTQENPLAPYELISRLYQAMM